MIDFVECHFSLGNVTRSRKSSQTGCFGDVSLYSGRDAREKGDFPPTWGFVSPIPDFNWLEMLFLPSRSTPIGAPIPSGRVPIACTQCLTTFWVRNVLHSVDFEATELSISY